MIPVVLGLGSNTVFNGLDSLHILAAACNELKNLFAPYAEKMIISSVYRTKALYVTDQSDFYNMAVYCFVSDSCTPHSLLEKIHVIEARYGRDRSREIRFGPRPLDIDIELFGKRTVNEPDLQIPHPRLSERAFVLTPMLEILPVSADCVKIGFQRNGKIVLLWFGNQYSKAVRRQIFGNGVVVNKTIQKESQTVTV